MTVASLPPSPLFGRRERLWPTVVASLAVHAAAIAIVLFARPAPVIDLGQKPITARLVRLGEKRDPRLLPRKIEGPMPAAPAPAPVATAPRPAPVSTPPPPAKAPVPGAKTAPAAPAPPRTAASRAGAPGGPGPQGGDPLARALSQVRGQVSPPVGSPDGDPFGDAEEGEGGDQYLALVTRALQDTYNLPVTISEKERLYLKATVLLFIEPDGRVSRFRFEERSGNGVFDAALERAIRSARLPPPPAERAQQYRSQGLAVLYRP